MKVLVIGSSGLVGRNLVRECEKFNIKIRGTYLSTDAPEADRQLDKTEANKVDKVVDDEEPELIVDVAAFHDVDACESERAKAWEVNAAGTYNVAAAADRVDAHLVYLSTDYVFPGNPEETPYTETDPVAPLNYYAQTKYAAEQAAKVPDRWTVLRPAVIYGLASSNFLTWVLGELRAGNEVSIVDDQVSTPTFARDIARACLAVGEQELTGLYHATGPNSCSRYEFVQTLVEAFDLDASLVNPITTEELGQEASRPSDGSLDSTRLYEAIGYQFTPLRDAFETIADGTE